VGTLHARWVTLSVAGVVTTSPTRRAAVAGRRYGIPFDLERISTRGGGRSGCTAPRTPSAALQVDASNQIAAMPSLHSAFALLAVVFVGSACAGGGGPLLAAYPLAMTFTLMYGGEHWMIDVLAGWAYVLVTLAVVGGAERWWTRRRLSRELADINQEHVPAPVG
jgi:membrane-associated phospholipid phosphatase